MPGGGSLPATPRGHMIRSGSVQPAKAAPTISGQAAMRSPLANPRAAITGSMILPTRAVSGTAPRRFGLSFVVAMPGLSHGRATKPIEAVGKKREVEIMIAISMT